MSDKQEAITKALKGWLDEDSGKIEPALKAEWLQTATEEELNMLLETGDFDMGLKPYLKACDEQCNDDGPKFAL